MEGLSEIYDIGSYLLFIAWLVEAILLAVLMTIGGALSRNSNRGSVRTVVAAGFGFASTRHKCSTWIVSWRQLFGCDKTNDLIANDWFLKEKSEQWIFQYCWMVLSLPEKTHDK